MWWLGGCIILIVRAERERELRERVWGCSVRGGGGGGGIVYYST